MLNFCIYRTVLNQSCSFFLLLEMYNYEFCGVKELRFYLLDNKLCVNIGFITSHAVQV